MTLYVISSRWSLVLNTILCSIGRRSSLNYSMASMPGVYRLIVDCAMKGQREKGMRSSKNSVCRLNDPLKVRLEQ
jgi:hypothetical protein